MSKLQKVLDIYKRYGFSGFFNKLDEKLRAPYRDYNEHIAEYLPSKEELEEQKRTQTEFSIRPLISIVVPTYETNERFLTELLDSVRNQTYPRWELILSDGSSTDRVKNTLESYQDLHPEISDGESKIRYEKLEKNGGISENTNGGIRVATGEYIAFMDHDDVLTENALYEVVAALNEKHYRLLYTDEDKVNADLTHYEQPHFKKDFDLELLRTNNYICHFLVIDAALLSGTGGFRSEYDGSQDYDLTLRTVERLVFPEGHYEHAGRDEICHIPKICYHWRMHDASTAGNSSSKSYTVSAGQRAVEAHFERLGIKAAVEERIEVGCYRITYPEVEDPAAAEQEIEVKLADGLVPRNENWKQELIRTCMQENVSAVCGKIYQKDGTVDSCGYVTDADGNTVKQFHGLKGSFKGYERKAVLKQETENIDGSFAVIKKSCYGKPGMRMIFDPDVEADWKE